MPSKDTTCALRSVPVPWIWSHRFILLGFDVQKQTCLSDTLTECPGSISVFFRVFFIVQWDIWTLFCSLWKYWNHKRNKKQWDSRTSLEAPCSRHNSLAQSWTDSHRPHSTLLCYSDIRFCGNTHSHLNFFSFKMKRPLSMLLSPSQFGKNSLWRKHPLILQYIEHTTFYSILLCFWEKSSSCLQLIKVIEKLFRNFLFFLLYVLASFKMRPAAEDITRWLH